MSHRLVTQGCRQVHRRDPSNNSKACEPCGQPSRLTRNTVAALRGAGAEV
jgi:rRNA maturation endonuclease Nob1